MTEIVPEVLRALRERRGWSQEELAENTRYGRLPKIDKQTISRLERGEAKRPRGRTVQQLARALGVEIAVLTGGAPLPVHQPSSPKDSLKTLIGAQHHNALSLVAWRYGVTTSQIVEMAPFLFWWAAEASLNQRRRDLARLQEAYEAAQNIERNIPHLPGHDSKDTTDEIIRAEAESIHYCDLVAMHIDCPSDPKAGNPFERFLRELGDQIDDGNGRFDYFDTFDTPTYMVCASEAAELVANDQQSAKEILEGFVSLSDLPERLRIYRYANDFPEERAAWIRERANEIREEHARHVMEGERNRRGHHE